MNYFLSIEGRVVGPMTPYQVLAYNVNPNTHVSTDGINWKPLYAFPELMEIYNNRQAQSNDSKRILCGVLAIFLGYLGIQYFIIGKTSAGIYTILLSLVTCGAWEIVTLIQGILMLCMSDAEFDRKYVNTPSSFPLF